MGAYGHNVGYGWMNMERMIAMVEDQAQTEWTGRRGQIGAWFLASPWRRWGEALFGRSRAALLDEVFSTLIGEEVVLDVGCGSGYLSLPIAARLDTGKVLCLDLSEEMLAGLEKRAHAVGLDGRVQAVKAPADASGLAASSVNLVVCNNVLHELADPGACAEEWARLLKPGGRMALSDFRATRPIRLMMKHRHGEDVHGPFTTEELEALLKKVGLREVKVTPYRHTLLAQAVK
jgi:ubiquinone/menaquinone biosynthesis C-methylase UbiE